MMKAGFKDIVLLGLLAVVSACTASRPPSPYLPDRSMITPGPTVTVKSNENVYTIARQHNVSMREIIVLNDLKPPYTLRKGQSLVLPAGGSGEMAAPVSSPLTPVDKTALPPVTPPAVSAEPLPPIAPAPVQPSAPQPAYEFKPGLQAAPMPATQLPTRPVPETDVVQALNSPAPPPRVAETTAAPPSLAETPLSMKWPIQGPILSSFGGKTGGMTNDGINIGAPKGAPVVSSAPGIVVYAGNEMKGFGNLVLIRHEGDLVTAYSHLDRVLVKKDSVVAQGDMIGTVGKTGNVATPQLHFEVRLDGKAVDPAKFVKGAL